MYQFSNKSGILFCTEFTSGLLIEISSCKPCSLSQCSKSQDKVVINKVGLIKSNIITLQVKLLLGVSMYISTVRTI